MKLNSTIAYPTKTAQTFKAHIDVEKRIERFYYSRITESAKEKMSGLFPVPPAIGLSVLVDKLFETNKMEPVLAVGFLVALGATKFFDMLAYKKGKKDAIEFAQELKGEGIPRENIKNAVKKFLKVHGDVLWVSKKTIDKIAQ